jgi:hypothetical protein
MTCVASHSSEDGSESCHSRSLSSSSALDVDHGRDMKDDEVDDVSSSVKVVVRVRPVCHSEVGYGQCIDTLTSSRRRQVQMPDIVRIGGEVCAVFYERPHHFLYDALHYKTV